MNAALVIITVCALVAASGALLGPFLILRRMAMLTDAISHSILFGIVLGYLIFRSTDSLPMMLAAGAAGLLTVWLSELLFRSGRVRQDAAIGLVFPALFSLGVILVTRLLDNQHIDVDSALVGEVIWAPFDTITLGGAEVPRALLLTGGLLVVNAVFVGLFYKELKLVAFDPALATALGFPAGVVSYTLMALVSITAVGAFDAVGAVLLIGFMIVPAATAYLLTDRLPRLIGLAALLGVLGSGVGYALAIALNANISGTVVSVLGVQFALALILAPGRGLLAGWRRHRRQRWEFAARLLLLHVLNHEGSSAASSENARAGVHRHLNWPQPYAGQIIARAEQRGWLQANQPVLQLTASGRALARDTLSQ